jgi:hypothetical protein
MQARRGFAAGVRIAALGTVVVLALAALVGPVPKAAGNAWLLLTGRGYVIPSESSIFAFEATVMNDGSGEWWLYGEDGRNYYAYLGAPESPYVTYAKVRAISCQGFDPHEIATWCD